MPPSRSRYVTACQQLLALGVVLVALAPATRVVSLDVVGGEPSSSPQPVGAASRAAGRLGAATPTRGLRLSADAQDSERAAKVPSGVVDPTVREVPLTAGTTTTGRVARTSLDGVLARTTTSGSKLTRITSRPEAVRGYGTIGVTWQYGQQIPPSQIHLRVRTERNGVWTSWQKLDYDDDGPDPNSAEGEHARPGTDETVVGRVDRVQVQITAAAGQTPSDMKLAVINPGRPATTSFEKPAIDTSRLDGGLPGARRGTGTLARKASTNALTAVTPEPQIYSRAQWGADESMRSASSLHYYEVHGGFIHHTATGNDYSQSEVPAIIRSIYAYHVRSRGWSDIGYNYLVDRFGRIWEGRYGGVDRPVVGAHTLGYNDYSFGASAIGNYDITKPSPAMIHAFAALFAWKLSLHGVTAGAGPTQIGPTVFAHAINGHRDAESTICPGRYLYAKIPKIRALATADQASWAGRDLQSNLVGSPYPDIALRKASNHQLVLLPLKGPGRKAGKKIKTGVDLTDADAILEVGDWDRDGFGDLVIRQASTGNLLLYRGNGKGHFAAPTVIGTGFNAVTLLTAVGDYTGDGYPDLIGEAGNEMYIWPGAGSSGLAAPYVVGNAIADATAQYGAGLWDGDGAPDTIARIGNSLVLYPGNGAGGLTVPVTLPSDVSVLDWIEPVADDSGDGHPDLVARVASTGDFYLFPATSAGFGAPVFLKHGSKYDMVG